MPMVAAGGQGHEGTLGELALLTRQEDVGCMDALCALSRVRNGERNSGCNARLFPSSLPSS